MVKPKKPSDDATIRCGTHGTRAVAVVCGHLLRAKDRVVGFVENSSEPDDLQAWCDACEALYLREDGMTAEFKKFHDVSVVCDFCYARIRDRHSKLEKQDESSHPSDGDVGA